MHTIDKKLSLRIVGTVTLCVVKFQRKRALAFLNRIDLKFDKEKEIGNLTSLATIDVNKLIRTMPTELNYVVRKFDLEYSYFNVNPLDVLALIDTCNESKIYILLGYMIEKCDDEIAKQIINKIKPLINKCTDEVRLFLENKMDKHSDKKINQNLKLQLNARRLTRKTISVEKTNQSVKTNFKNLKKEEEVFKMLELSFQKEETFTNSSNIEEAPKPSQDEEKGLKQRFKTSLFKTRWSNCLNLYIEAKLKGTLKKEGKDDYLPAIFLKDHYIVKTEAKVIWSFYINRMIAFTSNRISKKQQLNETLIQKLMLFVESLDKIIDRLNLSKICLAEFFPEIIYDKCEEIKDMKEPDILKTFANQIIDKTIKFKGNKKEKIVEFNRKEIKELVEKEIKDLRLDAVNALYNASSKNQKYLNKERIDKITKCLSENNENDAEFNCILQKIVDLIEYNSIVDYKSLFYGYIGQLHKKDFSNSDFIIRFLGRQSRNEEKCQELFNVEIIEKLIEIFAHSEKQDVLEIINNYLNHESSEPLKKELLETFIQLSEKVNQVFFTILLSVSKTKKWIRNRLKN
jgi:hypothetical protein